MEGANATFSRSSSRGRGFDSLERYQDRGAYVIGSHFCDPTGGWIVRDGAAWRFEGE